MPRLRYDFRPIVLTRAIVDSYITPEALKVFASPSSTDAIGVVGPSFTAIQQDAGAALIQSGDVRGWGRLPALSTSRSEVVDFVGGVIRVLRADWTGAADLFARVIANKQAPTALKVDGHLYRAVALERSNASGSDELERAYALNPYDRTVVSYMLMRHVVVLARTSDSDPARPRLVAEARRLLDANRYLFPAADPFLARVAAYLQ